MPFHGALLRIFCKAQIHVFAEVGSVFFKTGHDQPFESVNLKK
jgi:hypothetical protein